MLYIQKRRGTFRSPSQFVTTVIVIITSGCSIAFDTVQITFAPPFNISLGNDTAICPNVNLILTPGPGFTYLWNNSTTNSTLTVNTAGTYSVMATNSLGCVAFDTINVSLLPPLSINIGNDTAVCPVTNILLNPVIR